MAKKRLVILISGGGTNMQSVITAADKGVINAEVVGVISTNVAAGGLIKAQNAGIKTFVCPLNEFTCAESRDKKMAEVITELAADYIVLAGFLGVLTAEFVEKFPKKIINIHPSLLPKYGGKGFFGLNVHKAVIAAGEKISGATVHYVDHGIDTGEIILHKEVPVLLGDTPEILQERVLKTEHELLIDALKKIL